MEKTYNNKKWEIYYQGWFPFDKETNEYFEQQRDKYIKREIKRRQKKDRSTKPKSKNNGATKINNQWREYLAK